MRICFVVLNAYPAIDPNIPGPIGGMETRAWSLARGLAQIPNISVSFLVRHFGPLRQNVYDGVTLHLLEDPWYPVRESIGLRLERKNSFPWWMLREPQWCDLWTIPWLALQRLGTGSTNFRSPLPICQTIPADCFLTFGIQPISSRVIAAAHARGLPAILFPAASFPEIGGDEEELRKHPLRTSVTKENSPALFQWLVHHADAVFCQTSAQQQQLQQLGRSGFLLRNPISLSEWSPFPKKTLSSHVTTGLERFALWIGRSESIYKQPLLLLELARQCPEVSFLMVMNRRDERLDTEVRSTAPDNVRIIERIDYDNMPAVMQRAAVLINTSSSEGFPNTFLQAAACGVPVASLRVESEFLRSARAGLCSEGNLSTLAAYVRECWQQPRSSLETGLTRRYLEEHHSLERQSQLLATELRKQIALACSKK